MPDTPVPAVPDPAPDPAAAAPPQGNLFQTYDPQGALGGLFAPAYIRGYAPSEAAVANWQAANRGTTRADVEASRMPQVWRDPATTMGGSSVYGGPIQANQSYGDPQGMVDPEALKAWAQGGKYDMNARRNAIAARIAANAAASAGAPPPALAVDPQAGMKVFFD